MLGFLDIRGGGVSLLSRPLVLFIVYCLLFFLFERYQDSDLEARMRVKSLFFVIVLHRI